MIDELGFEPDGEALGRVLGQTDVLVHVEGRDAVPVDAGLVAESGEHLALAGGRGEDHAKMIFAAQALAQRFANVARCDPAKLGAGFRYMNVHDVLLPFR